MSRVYLVGPVSGGAAQRAALVEAFASLHLAGHEVTAPALTRTAPETLDDLLDAMSEDLDALAACDAVMALPGSEDLVETTQATLLGIPIWVPSAASETLTAA